jgi:predicted transcriptional regulator
MAGLSSSAVAKANRKTPPPPLHELEALVMEEVWGQGEATVRDVLTALNRGSKERAYTTVMTIMARLDTKGLLTRERRGKSDLYRPVMSQSDYLDARAKAEVEAMVAEFGDLALAHFATRLDRLGPRRRRQLRKLAGRE